MSQPENTPPATSEVTSLEDLVVTYDMGKLLVEARAEYDSIIASRELLGQEAIGNFFNLNLKDDERN
ncbi:hypothetical protein [Pelagicoccus sp. SDUM812002]|uniref:hypothetical protein n=1 Tax=Pelagicoccus sp. SDUM812002 TaxID=3041266 RepID=UPI002810916B|nr:hypothetical protein [Pelagicoccus sp. SDUM812002]MDQ8186326.1 hypothetical protein [Pelagicoccus sp. SDUM812002]